MKPRGLMLALDYPPARGGISRLLEGWSQDTDEIEWRVVCLTAGEPSGRVHRASSLAPLLAAIRQNLRWLRGADTRIVVAGHPYLSLPAVIVATLGRARSACTVFGLELIPRTPAHRVAITGLRFVHRVVAISEFTAEIAVRTGARPSRIAVVHPQLRPPWSATRVQRRSPQRGLRLVTLTRLTEGYKNLELLIRLTAVLHPLGVVERLTIIGDGPRRDALGKKARTLGVEHVVDLPGYIPDDALPVLLAHAHVALFPSRYSIAENGFEGFGLVAQELAAAGLPVLVGAAGGAVDAAAGSWAWLLDPDDLWAWVDAVERLNADEDRRLAMSEAALQWARSIEPKASALAFAGALLNKRAAAGGSVGS